jgi:phenylalanyl-tRNA synthetase alpha chain
MGLPSDVSVIAWGLSLERPTMIYYGLSSIKDLSGEEVQLRETKNASIYCINIA